MRRSRGHPNGGEDCVPVCGSPTRSASRRSSCVSQPRSPQRRRQLRRRRRCARRQQQPRRRWFRRQYRAQRRRPRRRRRAKSSVALSDAAEPDTAAATAASPCWSRTAKARPRCRPSGCRPHVPRCGSRHKREDQNDCCLLRRRRDRRDSSHLYVALRGQHDDGESRAEAGHGPKHQPVLTPTTAAKPTNRTVRFCLAAPDATLTTVPSPPTRW